VVLLSDSEDEHYDPRAVTAVLTRYEAAEVALPPDVARPFVYASERSRYFRAVGSPARRSVRATATALAARLAADGTAADVRVAFCDPPETLAEVVTNLAREGASRIVVAALTVAWTRSFEVAVAETMALGAETAGVRIEVTDPMWASPHIAAMAAQRSLAALAVDPDAGGVVLVSEGEPWQGDRDDPAPGEQTTFFAQRVRAELIGAGLGADRIRRAWLEWEEPDVSEAVRHLAALGARRIALLPVTFPTEAIATLIDLRFAAERAAEETGTVTAVLRAWDDDPAVVESLVEGIEASAERLHD
jgi:protoheme ferro-lyase